MQFREAIIQVNGKTYELRPNRSNTFDDIFIDFQHETDTQGHGDRYAIFLHPKQDVIIQKLEIRFQAALPVSARFLVNGYQSCSETRSLPVTTAMPRLNRFIRRRVGYQGDDWIKGIPRGKGQLHSWTYTYIIKDPALGHGLFAGSLNERTGFTLFLYDQASGTFTIRKDLDGLALHHSFPALDVWMAEGTEQKVYEAWSEAAEIPLPQAPAGMGWSSKNLSPGQVTAAVMQAQLEGYAQWKNAVAPEIPSFFMVEDGWQSALGDWLTAGPAFPEGMGTLAASIQNKGLQPGLWLAPFLASAKAEIVRRNPEWLLRDTKGQPIKVGFNPLWGGWYYALDFYQDGVKEYLSGVFHRMLDQWGYTLLKLDALFAVSLAPPPGKTRGGVMWEAMAFLRQQMGQKRMIACGVPLGSAFGQADYCRINADVSVDWESSLAGFWQHRERPEALASLHSLLTRWPLQGHMLQAVPDLVSLSSGNRKQLTLEQQQTVLLFHALLGGLLCTSDDVVQYSDLQEAEMEEALWVLGRRILEVKELDAGVWRIVFVKDGQSWAAHGNLGPKLTSLNLPRGGELILGPGESIVLKW